jgi:hypothetical protein
MSAALCFAFTNTFINEVTVREGLYTPFYLTGAVVFGIFYNFYNAFLTYRSTGVFWNDLNFVVDGKVKYNHIYGFFVYCAVFTATQNLVYLTFFFAGAAGLNIGVITVIYSVDSVYLSIADYYIYGQKLM